MEKQTIMINKTRYLEVDILNKTILERTKPSISDTSIITINVRNGKINISNTDCFHSYIKCAYDYCWCHFNPFIWVSHKYKVIYFEVPKSASSSIKKRINAQIDLFYIIHAILLKSQRKVLFKINIPFYERKTIKTITNAVNSFNRNSYYDDTEKVIKLKEGYSNQHKESQFEPFWGSMKTVLHKYPNYFSFSFVRSPFDRMVSNWSMFTQKKVRKPVIESLFNKKAETISFEEFVKKTAFLHNHHWQSQSDFLPFDHNDTCMLDFIGKLESMQSSWDKVASYLSINKDLPHINVSNHKNYQYYNNTIIKNSIKNRYKSDFKHFYPNLL